MVPPLRSKPASRAEGGPPLRAADGPTLGALKSRALRWLAQRDHSRAELERKLIAHARALARLAEAAQAGAGPTGPPDAPAPDAAIPNATFPTACCANVSPPSSAVWPPPG